MLMIVAPVLLLVLGAAAFFFLKPQAPPVSEEALAKQPGPVYTMVEPFVVNLADKTPHLAKVGVALQLSKASAAKLPAAEGAKVPKLEEDAQLRDIVISAIQEQTSATLSSAQGRQAVKQTIVSQVNKQTELRIIGVYYTEFAVQ